MARKEKFSKEEILTKSVEFVREYGIDQLTVRELAKYIGCSTQPIFRFYDTLADFKKDLNKYLDKEFNEFIKNYVNPEDDYLLTISYAYVLFSKMQSNIFKALFIFFKYTLSKSSVMEDVICKQYKINADKAKMVNRDVGFYVHGLATQICYGCIKYNNFEIYDLINNMIGICLKKG